MGTTKSTSGTENIDDAIDKAHEEGRKAAFAEVFRLVARELGVTSDVGKLAHLLAERSETVAKLREVCEEFGDNDWTDGDHLPEVIEKHLACYLDNPVER